MQEEKTGNKVRGKKSFAGRAGEENKRSEEAGLNAAENNLTWFNEGQSAGDNTSCHPAPVQV